MPAVTTFATAAQVTSRLGIGTSVDATLIGEILDGVTAAMARYCNRMHDATNLMLRNAAFVEDVEGNGGRVIQLSLYPIETITSLVDGGSSRDFTNGTTYTEDTDYVVDKRRGVLINTWQNWSQWPMSLRVTYTGGYVDPGSTPSTGQIALPKDVIEACIRQCAYIYKQRHALGARTIAQGDGSIAYFDPGILLADVRAMLDPFKRVVAL